MNESIFDALKEQVINMDNVKELLSDAVNIHSEKFDDFLGWCFSISDNDVCVFSSPGVDVYVMSISHEGVNSWFVYQSY